MGESNIQAGKRKNNQRIRWLKSNGKVFEIQEKEGIFMNCKIVEDMITLYAENLCSEDSKTMVEEHIETCENCRKKLEDYKTELAEELYQDKKIEQDKTKLQENTIKEINPFKKIKKTMWYRSVLNVVLAVILIIIVCITGFLTYNQVNKEFVSFETIADGIAAKKLCEKFAKGDIDGFIDGLDISCFSYVDSDSINAFMEDQRKDLAEIYQNQLKDKKIKVFLDAAAYTTVTDVEKRRDFAEIFAVVGIQIEKDYTLYLDLEKSGCEKFKLSGMWHIPELDEKGYAMEDKYEEMNAILNRFSYSQNAKAHYETYKAGIMFTLTRQEEPGKQEMSLLTRQEEPDKQEMSLDTFLKNPTVTEETEKEDTYGETVKKRIKTLMEQQVTIEDYAWKDVNYDKEKKAFFTEMLWSVQDHKTGNSAIVATEFEVGEDGFYKTEKGTKVIAGEMKEEVKKELEEVFE